MGTAPQEHPRFSNRFKREWHQQPAWQGSGIPNRPVPTLARAAAKVAASPAHMLGAAMVPAAVGLLLLGLAGCAQSPFGDDAATAVPPSPIKSVSEALKADPRFTDFNQVISVAGLAQELDDAGEITVFAPTNAAFAQSDPGWRASLAPHQRATGGSAIWRRQAWIEGAFITGSHPASEFAGKLQDVRSVDGTVFHVDGRVPGAVTVTTGAQRPAGIGFATVKPRAAHLQLQPIQTRNGLIYPVDAIIVADRN